MRKTPKPIERVDLPVICQEFAKGIEKSGFYVDFYRFGIIRYVQVKLYPNEYPIAEGYYGRSWVDAVRMCSAEFELYRMGDEVFRECQK
jgi:hypothetical protein